MMPESALEKERMPIKDRMVSADILHLKFIESFTALVMYRINIHI